MDIFLKACAIGFSIAVPVGPIGVLTIQRSLNEGRRAGFATGLGAATADGMYGLMAGLGLSALITVINSIAMWMKLAGGVFLIYLGIKIALSKPPSAQEKLVAKGNWYNYYTTFLLTATSPATIFVFLSVFTSLGITNGVGNAFDILLLVVGVFSGSALWWFFLSFGMSKISHKIGTNGLTWINRLSGMLVVGFGLVTIFSIFL